MADVDLVGFSEERIVPNFHEGIITNAEQQMTLKIEVHCVEPIPMEGLHFDFNGHLHSVVPTNRSIFEDDPQFLAFEFDPPCDLAQEDLAKQL